MEKKRIKEESKKQPKHTKIEGVGIGVKVINGNIEQALKIFKRVFKDAGIVDELRYRQQFTKKSAIKREQKMKAIRRQEIETLKEKLNNNL